MGFLSLLITVAVAATNHYTNHSVGGDTGWFFNPTTNAPFSNYTNWAANQTFNLGDYLIFNTNGNQTVIQTYNETIYRSCDFHDAPDGAYAVQYMGGDTTAKPLTVAIPLTQVGLNYYFSDVYDGMQCRRGMAFEIEVKNPPFPYVSPPFQDSLIQLETPSSSTSTPSDQKKTFDSVVFSFRLANWISFSWLLFVLFFALETDCDNVGVALIVEREYFVFCDSVVLLLCSRNPFERQRRWV
ncbi:hypothetical protein NE237_011978 [Protea cynaroides]|uniref:Phytocyanin domain-containing protein n=1 Tax=Protea cynaroides TaxID=273540 RepID=A0A9Q0GZA1_9MAGN|nr:hypothetical protein NE237_011978 [Protea cynaroides]